MAQADLILGFRGRFLEGLVIDHHRVHVDRLFERAPAKQRPPLVQAFLAQRVEPVANLILFRDDRVVQVRAWIIGDHLLELVGRFRVIAPPEVDFPAEELIIVGPFRIQIVLVEFVGLAHRPFVFALFHQRTGRLHLELRRRLRKVLLVDPPSGSRIPYPRVRGRPQHEKPHGQKHTAFPD